MLANQIQHYLKHKHIIHSGCTVTYTPHQLHTHAPSTADAPHISSPRTPCNTSPCSNTCMPHQHHMHSLSAPHTHIHLHTPNIKPRGSMLKNKDLNFKALIKKTKTQSESLSPHSTMSHALTHTHLYANQNQNQHHHWSEQIQSMYPQKKKKNTKHVPTNFFSTQKRTNRSLTRTNKIFNKYFRISGGTW